GPPAPPRSMARPALSGARETVLAALARTDPADRSMASAVSTTSPPADWMVPPAREREPALRRIAPPAVLTLEPAGRLRGPAAAALTGSAAARVTELLSVMSAPLESTRS